MADSTATATPTAEETARISAEKLAADTTAKAEVDAKAKADADAAAAAAADPAKKAADEAAKKSADEAAAKKATEEAEAKAKELKLPEGSKLDVKRLDTFKALAKEKGWTPEDAQARLQAESDAVTNYDAQMQANMKAQGETWVAELKKHPEIGGDKFGESAEMAKRVVAKFGSESLKTALDSTGLGNHPGLVEMLVKIGKSMSADSLIPAGHQPKAGEGKSAADKLFGLPPTKE